jgi:hypothetical protein
MARRVEIKKQIDSTYYTFAINPIEFQDLDNQNLNIDSTIDGYSFEFRPIFDGRPRIMHWDKLPNKEPYITMVSTLKSLIGYACHLRLNYLSGSSSDTTVQNIRVVDVQTTKTLGGINDGGHVKYGSIDLIYVPIP